MAACKFYLLCPVASCDNELCMKDGDGLGDGSCCTFYYKFKNALGGSRLLLQCIEKTRLKFIEKLEGRGYFEPWELFEDLTDGSHDDIYTLGVEIGIFRICSMFSDIKIKQKGDEMNESSVR